MNAPLQKLRQLILPPRPDPARSRRIAEGRLMIVCLVAFGIFITIGVRIVGLADASASTRHAQIAAAITTERGRILDRKGRLLAGNLPITVLHADPSEIMDARDAAAKLAPLLNQHDHASLIKLLTKKTRYVELDRQLPPKRHAQILQLGIPGVYFAKGAVRVYPREHAAAHILGHVDTDNIGIAGIEKSLNAKLAAGEDVTLSIDLGLQAVIRREIQRQIDKFEAIGGAGILLDIKSGEMLAVASLPDFNPNQFALASDDMRFNRATKGLYEMGSTFKVLNTAIALESGAACQKAFDDTVFKRMKRNHRQNTARAQKAFNRLKPSRQFVKFAIDENPQGLKTARCRINLAGSFGWHNAMDNGGQLAGACNVGFLADAANGLGDAA
jgi:cell division protein FtsI (penicillin-binding protein 3)